MRVVRIMFIGYQPDTMKPVQISYMEMIQHNLITGDFSNGNLSLGQGTGGTVTILNNADIDGHYR